jgi:translation initiation factor IF-2
VSAPASVGADRVGATRRNPLEQGTRDGGRNIYVPLRRHAGNSMGDISGSIPWPRPPARTSLPSAGASAPRSGGFGSSQGGRSVFGGAAEGPPPAPLAGLHRTAAGASPFETPQAFGTTPPRGTPPGPMTDGAGVTGPGAAGMPAPAGAPQAYGTTPPSGTPSAPRPGGPGAGPVPAGDPSSGTTRSPSGTPPEGGIPSGPPPGAPGAWQGSPGAPPSGATPGTADATGPPDTGQQRPPGALPVRRPGSTLKRRTGMATGPLPAGGPLAEGPSEPEAGSGEGPYPRGLRRDACGQS